MKKYLLPVLANILFIIIAGAAGYGNDITYTYDQLNRLTGVTYGDGTTIEYGYDPVGNRITQNVSGSSDFKARFTASPTSGPAPLTVTFTDQSTGTVSSWSWDFGDGGSSTSRNPSHTFSSAGTFAVTLTVSNAAQSSSQSATITVDTGGPIADFSASPTSGTAPLKVSFTNHSTGIITGWSWNFGDGGTSSSENPTHTYTAAGTYTATLTVSGPRGNPGTKSISISVNPLIPPVAGFNANPSGGTAPLAVSFTDSSTGTVTGWSWNFGDGATSSSRNPSHTYTGAGTYVATLVAGGPTGLTNAQSASITVTPAIPPVADFSAAPTDGDAPLRVQFTDTSTGSITSWSWDFGDGSTSTIQSPGHIYSTAGTRTVSLTATGPGGSSTKTQTNYINVTPSYGIDPYTKLMLHLNGLNTGKTFIDSESIPKTVTGYGNAQISTAYSKFGGSSLKLDGNNSYLSVAPSTDWNLSGDFTIDFWWYRPGGSSYSPLIDTGGNGCSLLIVDYAGDVYLWMSSNGSSWDIANVKIGTPSRTGFDHYAVVQTGEFCQTYQNGVLTNSFLNLLPPYYNGSQSLKIGTWSGYYATGYLDEVRISKGNARWTSNFTPPDLPYTEGSSPPAADFSASPTSGPAPLPVQFTDSSTGSITGWLWDFGDGSTSTAQYPNHTYSTPGTYTVSLTATGPGGSNTNTKTSHISVLAELSYGIDQHTKLMLHLNGPNAGRTFTDSESIPKTVTGYGNAQISTAYSKFGGASLKLDGNYSYLSLAPSPDWNLSGDFTIDFWWYRPGGSSYSPLINTGGNGNSLLIADYSGTVYVWMSSTGSSWDIASTVKIGTPSGTGFDHYALVRAGGTYYTFQNGILTNSFQSLLSPYYNASRSLNIGTISGYYAKGYLDEVRISTGVVRWLSNFTPPDSPYTEGSSPPAANFSASPTSGPAPLPVQFTDSSTGSITGWLWDFGDGSTSTAQYPNHTYSTPGTYTVSLTATGPGGGEYEYQDKPH